MAERRRRYGPRRTLSAGAARRCAALLAPLLVLAIACNQSGAGAAGPTGASTEAANDRTSPSVRAVADVEACGLLTTAEIAERGRVVSGGPTPDTSEGVSRCYFYVGMNGSLDCGCTSSPGYIEGQITLTLWPADDAFRAVRDGERSDPSPMDAAEPIEGLGVEAYYRGGRGAIDVLLEDGRHFALELAEVGSFGTAELREELLAWARLAVSRL